MLTAIASEILDLESRALPSIPAADPTFVADPPVTGITDAINAMDAGLPPGVSADQFAGAKKACAYLRDFDALCHANP